VQARYNDQVHDPLNTAAHLLLTLVAGLALACGAQGDAVTPGGRGADTAGQEGLAPSGDAPEVPGAAGDVAPATPDIVDVDVSLDADSTPDVTDLVVPADAAGTTDLVDLDPAAELPDATSLPDIGETADVWDVPDVAQAVGFPPTCTLGPKPFPKGAPKPGWPSAPSTDAIPFMDITDATGVMPSELFDACGIFMDMTNDGLPDIVTIRSPKKATEPRQLLLMRQDGQGGWAHSTAAVPTAFMVTDCVPIDYNRDGYKDVLVAGSYGVKLFKNTGTGFQDVTAQQIPKAYQFELIWSAAAIDYDRDGWPDLYLARTGALNLQCGQFSCKWVGLYINCETNYPLEPLPNALLHNAAGNSFVDATAGSNADDAGATLNATILDYDRDGWPDIFAGNDFGPLNLYRNNGDATFSKAGKELGILPYGHFMGLEVTDFDNDGYPDLAHAAFGPASLFRGKPDGTFYDDSAASGLIAPTADTVSWGQLAGDFNNDGRRDLLVGISLTAKPGEFLTTVTCEKPAYDPTGGSLLFRNDGAGKMIPQVLPYPTGAAPAVDTTTVAAADLEGDGDLDLLIGYRPGKLRLYRNDAAIVSHWLRVHLLPKKSPPGGVGAFVRVHAGGQFQENYLSHATGYATHDEHTWHFGLGAVTHVDKVEVWWPCGAISEMTDLDVDQVLSLPEPESCGPPPVCPTDPVEPTPDAGAVDAAPPACPVPPAPTFDGFTDVSASLPFAKDEYAICAGVGDFDQSGTPDLLAVAASVGGGKPEIRVALWNGAEWKVVVTPFDTTVVNPQGPCSTADFDGDGHVDLILGGSPGIQFWRNKGDATFDDASATLGLKDYAETDAYTQGMADFDNDGLLDLYIGAGDVTLLCNSPFACQYAPGDFVCSFPGKLQYPETCVDRLFKRLPSGLLSDVTVASGIDEPEWGSIIGMADMDDDGLVDLFVGNDFGAHHLWHNLGGMKFEGLSTQIGLKDYGHTMGWGFGDFNEDGAWDVVMADAGPMELYLGTPGKLAFTDASPAWCGGATVQDASTWDPLAFDFDQDGHLDVFLATAGLTWPGDLVKLATCGTIASYPAQGGFYYRGDGTRFTPYLVPDAADKWKAFAFFAQTAVDYDGDGDLDIFQAYRSGKLRLLRNDISPKGAFVRVILKGAGGNAKGIGARLYLKVGGKTLLRQMHGASGFGQAIAPFVHFGIGSAVVADELKVAWPSGKVSIFNDVSANSTVVAKEP